MNCYQFIWGEGEENFMLYGANRFKNTCKKVLAYRVVVIERAINKVLKYGVSVNYLIENVAASDPSVPATPYLPQLEQPYANK